MPPGSRPGSTSTGSKAATTTTARSSANIARCSFFMPGHLRDDPAPPRGLFPPRVELRGRSLAQHRRGRGIHPARLHRRHARGRGARAREVQGAAHRTHAGRRAGAGVPAPAAGSLQRAPLMNDSSSTAAAAAHRSIRRTRGWACPPTPRRRRAYFHGRDEEAAELARRVQRKLLTVLFGQSGPRQDLAAARRHSCRGCAAKAIARSTCGSTTRPIRRRRPNRSSRRSSSATEAARALDPARRRPSRANRSGSSCTIAATCCATRAAARCCRC